MSTRLPKRVTEGYWKAVLELLDKKHNLSPSATKTAVLGYREKLNKNGVGEVIYHAPAEETAQGIAEAEGEIIRLTPSAHSSRLTG